MAAQSKFSQQEEQYLEKKKGPGGHDEGTMQTAESETPMEGMVPIQRAASSGGLMTGIMQGYVNTWYEEQGCGWITQDDVRAQPRCIFVHHCDLKNADRLKRKDRVSFVLKLITEGWEKSASTNAIRSRP